MDIINYVDIGRKIRAERRNRNWTQERLAEMSDISTSFLGHIERGTRKMSLDTAFVLAHILELPLDFIVGTKYESSYCDTSQQDTAQILLKAVIHILREASIPLE